MITIVAAISKNNVIGNNGMLPWDIPEEFNLFLSIIDGGTIIVGRKTWNSITSQDFTRKKYIVVSKSLDKIENVSICKTFNEAITLAQSFNRDIHVCGGVDIYKEAFKVADTLIISYIKKSYDGDTYFPKFNKDDWKIEKTKEYDEFNFVIYKKK